MSCENGMIDPPKIAAKTALLRSVLSNTGYYCKRVIIGIAELKFIANGEVAKQGNVAQITIMVNMHIED